MTKIRPNGSLPRQSLHYRCFGSQTTDNVTYGKWAQNWGKRLSTWHLWKSKWTAKTSNENKELRNRATADVVNALAKIFNMPALLRGGVTKSQIKSKSKGA